MIFLNEEEIISSEESLKKYAMALAKKSFDEEVDESIVDDIVKNAIEKNTDDETTDWGAAVGFVKNAYTS